MDILNSRDFTKLIWEPIATPFITCSFAYYGYYGFQGIGSISESFYIGVFGVSVYQVWRLVPIAKGNKSGSFSGWQRNKKSIFNRTIPIVSGRKNQNLYLDKPDSPIAKFLDGIVDLFNFFQGYTPILPPSAIDLPTLPKQKIGGGIFFEVDNIQVPLFALSKFLDVAWITRDRGKGLAKKKWVENRGNSLWKEYKWWNREWYNSVLKLIQQASTDLHIQLVITKCNGRWKILTHNNFITLYCISINEYNNGRLDLSQSTHRHMRKQLVNAGILPPNIVTG